MNRRDVIRIGSVLLFVPTAARLLVACDDDDEGTEIITRPDAGRDAGGVEDAGADAGEEDAGTDGGVVGPQTFSSSVVDAHSHDLTLEADELNSPPSAGVSRDTTVVEMHQHTVELTEAELEMIATGGTVTKDTTVVDGHFHTFTFTLMP